MEEPDRKIRAGDKTIRLHGVGPDDVPEQPPRPPRLERLTELQRSESIDRLEASLPRILTDGETYIDPLNEGREED